MAISAEDKNFLVSLYVGYFNRAPDPAGLQFWIDQVEAGRDTNTIAADFAASPEAKSLYPFLTTPDVSSPTSFITAVYANLFNRAPDAAGQAFWEAQLSSGAVSPADAIDAIIKGATTAPDSTILANKNVVGLDFATDAGNTPGFTFDLGGASGSAAKDAISGVTEDSATVTVAQAATDAYLSGVGGVAIPGQTFTLTDSVDELVGTANNDTFRAILDGTADTLTTFDDLDGAGGTDTFNLLLETATGDLPSGFEIANIEVVNLRSDGTGLLVNGGVGITDASAFTGATQVWSVGLAAATVQAGEGQTIGFRDTAPAATAVEAADGVDALSVALDTADAGSTVILTEATSEDVLTVSVSGSITDGDGTVDVSGLDAVTTVNLSLSEDGAITYTASANGTVETVDLSGSTGDIEIDLTGEAALATVTGGAAAESVTVNVEQSEDTTINLAGGNDTVVLDNGGTAAAANAASSITLGAGEDLVAVDTLENIFDATEAEFEAGLITIEDFSMANDVLDISGVGAPTVLTNQNLSDIAGQDNLFDAVTEAASILGAGAEAVFDYDGDAYYFVNDTDAAFDSGDGLIKLVGVSIEDFDSSNYVTA